MPTDDGPEVATCMWAPQWVSEDIGGLPVLAGMAQTADVQRAELSRRRRARARVAARRLAREHNLPMKIVGVDHVPDTGGYTIYFSAETRIDFRELVRDLNRTLAARVRLRQLSARDGARVQGGIGSCGRDLCCATFLTDFEPVSLRMARDQNLALNPMRISGACGRLMCCLRYEHPLYEEFAGAVPAVGERACTPQGEGRVVRHDVPASRWSSCSTAARGPPANEPTCACPGRRTRPPTPRTRLSPAPIPAPLRPASTMPAPTRAPVAQARTTSPPTSRRRSTTGCQAAARDIPADAPGTAPAPDRSEHPADHGSNR